MLKVFWVESLITFLLFFLLLRQNLVTLSPLLYRRRMNHFLRILMALVIVSCSANIAAKDVSYDPDYTDTLYNPLCEGTSFYFNDTLINSAGIYSDSMLLDDNQKHLVYMVVTMLPSYHDTIRATICVGDTFTQYGFNASQSGYYTQYRSTTYGCDSNLTLILSVREAYYDTIRATTCSGMPYTNYGFNESNAGTYTHFCKSSCGCDSVVTLVLSVDREYHDTITASIRSGEAYRENGFDEFTAGVFTMTGKTILGCDSTTTLILTTTIVDTTIDVIICPGDTFWFDGNPYSIPDTYYSVTSFGQTDVVPYHLIINLSFTAGASLNVDDGLLCADQGVLEIPYEYHSDVSARWCGITFLSGGFTDITDLPITADSGMLYVPLIEPTTDSTNYPRPDIYDAVISFDNGVCSPVAVEFKFEILYPSWIIHQKWNDVLMVLNKSYNGGYDFTAFQWYKDGVKIDGAKQAYLYLPERLDTASEYYVELTRSDDGKAIRSCALVPEMRDDGYVEYVSSYLNVYPTIVERSAAVVTVSTNSSGEYWVYTPTGKLIEYNTYECSAGSTFELHLPYISNVYFIKFKSDDNNSKTERIIVH